jgi:eukaryotic-like serine/threonine-protein kinase
MGEAATSRKMAVHAGWSDEESRAYLQERLNTLSSVMFWSFVILIAFMYLLYWRYPDVKPAHQDAIIWMSTGGVTVLAVIWRGFLARRTLTTSQLYSIDLFYAASIGTCFATAAYLAREFQPAGYACLVYASLMVMMRAIVVPSTGGRTAIASMAVCVPMVIAASAISGYQGALPRLAYIWGAVVFMGVIVLLATMGSRTLYTLRRRANAATQLGQYTLGAKIGHGGMGAVYRAKHTLLRRPTAIKLLHPDKNNKEMLDRFEREVQLTSQLTHPNTVAVFDYGRNPDGIFYYAMEYLDGIDLNALVVQYGPQPSDRVVSIVAQVCGALNEAHVTGIMHRDIKPANIILCERGAVPDVAKVVDFGLVKKLTADDGTSTRVILGTPAYLAPDPITDPDRVGPAADVYALGAVAYFLLTGKLVFDGATSVDICVKHVGKEPTPPSQVAAIHIPEALEALVLRCLAKDPTARPSSEDLAKTLRALPPTGDWNEEEALRWWDEFHAKGESAPVEEGSELTITVDLGRRGLPTPVPRRPKRTSKPPIKGASRTRRSPDAA